PRFLHLVHRWASADWRIYLVEYGQLTVPLAVLVQPRAFDAVCLGFIARKKVEPKCNPNRCRFPFFLRVSVLAKTAMQIVCQADVDDRVRERSQSITPRLRRHPVPIAQTELDTPVRAWHQL